MMRAPLLLALLFTSALWSPVFAQTPARQAPEPPPLTLSETLGRAEGRGAVVTARREQQDAAANLARVTRDPLAVRADLVQAEQRLALAEVGLERARYTAALELGGAYTGALQADAQVELAAQGLALSARALEIATIRLENGSATALDVQDARAAQSEAANTLRAAREARALARDNLSGMLGEAEVGALAGIPDAFVTELPPLGRVLERAQRHPELLGAAQQAELAELAAAVLDPLYAAQVQIDDARSQLESARRAFQEARRAFELQTRSLYSEAENARETLRLTAGSLRVARARLATQRQRLEGGLVAQIDFERAELDTAQVALEALAARAGYLNAQLELQAGTLVPLEGPFAVPTPPPPSETAGDAP
jgi:outer membrane protein TolC